MTRTWICTPLLGLLLLVLATAPTAAQLDVGGWEVTQENSSVSVTLPAGTVVQPGGYVVLCRYATKAEFESFYGVSLAANVVYLSNDVSNAVVPMINGDEIYRVYDDGSALVDGPTPAFNQSSGRSHFRNDPEAAPWTSYSDTPTPGGGVEAPDGVYSGLVITEVHDATSYVYEFVELYYDGDTGGANLPPVISSVDVSPADPEAGNDVTVTAMAYDPDGVLVNVWLYHRQGGGAYGDVTMTPAGGDDWTAAVPGVAGDQFLEYYVVCEDDGGVQVSSPAAAPTTVHSVWVSGTIGPGRVVLFDHAHDQDAGSNGNWRVDDNHPNPSPAVPSSETSWNGQLSSWGYELYQAGHTVRSTTTALSAGVLAGVDLLIIPEPQNPFSAAEIEAVRQFVYDGGALFFVADHNSSDRNNNGWDSASIFGGYGQPHISDPVGGDTETFCGALFGLHVHVKDEGNNGISGSYTNVATDPTNPVIHGSYGEVSELVWHVGNVMSLWPSANPDLGDVGGLVSKDEGSPHLMAWSRYGSGKVIGWGDSSSMADGTGSESHADNWHEASHRAAFLNGTMWLLASDLSATRDTLAPIGVGLEAFPNPFNPQTTVAFTLGTDGPVYLDVYDMAGRHVRKLLGETRAAGRHEVTWDGSDRAGRGLPSGVYFVTARGGGAVNVTKVVLTK